VVEVVNLTVPPVIDPGKPSRPSPGTASVRAPRCGSSVVAAPATARSPTGGSTADGTVRQAQCALANVRQGFWSGEIALRLYRAAVMCGKTAK
jgi:hypothetical protein